MNSNTINSIIPAIQGFLATQPISKAWLFGSYSRGEETRGSDVDIMVSFEEGAKISLFKYANMICQLEALLNLKVDLVEEGTLLPFAIQTANHDKILIYERGN
jgi:predicted nucleotidyltransferase